MCATKTSHITYLFIFTFKSVISTTDISSTLTIYLLPVEFIFMVGKDTKRLEGVVVAHIYDYVSREDGLVVKPYVCRSRLHITIEALDKAIDVDGDYITAKIK